MNNLRKYLSVWFVFIIGFIVSFLAFNQLYSIETHRHQIEFRAAVTEWAEALRDELTLYLSVLEASAAFFYASEAISAEEFYIFTTPLLNQRRSLYLLEWVPAVPHSQRKAYERLAQQRQPNFQFKEYELSQQLMIASHRDYYYPAYYLNSINSELLELGPNGFDLGSEGQRLLTLETARDTGEVRLTPWMSLLQLQGTHPVLPYGFLMVKAVYRQLPSALNNVSERQAQLRGFIVGGFILDDLIKGAFHHFTNDSFQFQISEIMPSGQTPPFTYQHTGSEHLPLSQTTQRLLRSEQILTVGGREWRLKAFALIPSMQWVWIVLFGGIAFTLLSCLHLLTLIQRNSETQREMLHRQQMATALAKQEAEFRHFVNHAPVMLWMTDAQDKCLLLNDTLREFVGNRVPDDFIQYWQQRIHPEDQADYHAIYQQAMGSDHQSFHRVYRVQRNDQTYRWIAETCIVRPDEEGLGNGLIGACNDITRRKEIEEALRAREAEFQTFLNHAPVMLWMSDSKGEQAMFNETLRRFAGLQLKSTGLGENWIALIHTEDVKHCRYIYRRAFALHEDYRVQYRCLRKDGYYRWIAETGAARFSSQGEFLGFTAACFDITQQKEAQQAVVESQRMLKTLMSNLPGMAYRCQNDYNWQMEFASEGCHDITGYSPEQFIANQTLAFADIIHPEDQENKWQQVQVALRNKVPYKLTYRIITAQDEERWVWEQGRGIFVWQGDTEILEALEGFILDVTEQKRIEEALQQARQMAEDASVAKSQFLANMSHELRTPLNAILGYTEILQEEAEDMALEEFTPDLQKILAAGRHLLGLINDILDISKIEAGKMELYLEDFAVQTVLEEVSTTVQPLMQQKNNQFILEADEELGEMHSDLLKLRQGLLNLLSNAAKFTVDGQVYLKIWSELDEQQVRWFNFNVLDTGIGMTEDQQARLFQSFSQADASTTRKYGGTGLGLAITKRFVEMMHGNIHVSSQAEVGSSFCIRLPARIENAPPTKKTAPATQTHPTLPVKDGVVLVIDDDADARELLTTYLSRVGYQVTTAADGKTGLALAKSLQPNAITLDIMMPGIDGWTVLGELRSDPQTADIPIIILSMVEDKNIGYSLGATDYLVKPVQREQLIALLRRYHIGETNFHVLIVEDDTNTREVITRTLEKAGCRISSAENGRVALDTLTRIQPDLILLDLTMPEMDGFEFLHHLRQDRVHPSIPVVVLTAREIDAEERAQLAGSVRSIFQKGAYQQDELLAEVNRLLLEAVSRPQILE